MCFQRCNCGNCELLVSTFLSTLLVDSTQSYQMGRAITDEDIIQLETHTLALKNELQKMAGPPTYSVAHKGISMDMVQPPTYIVVHKGVSMDMVQPPT